MSEKLNAMMRQRDWSEQVVSSVLTVGVEATIVALNAEIEPLLERLAFVRKTLRKVNAVSVERPVEEKINEEVIIPNESN